MSQYSYKILPTFEVELKDGKVGMSDAQKSRYTKFLLSNEGKYLLTLKKPTRRRSLRQNAYYHAVVLPILAESWGYEDLEELDDALEARFLPKQVKKLGKEEVLVAGRCSKQDTTAFGEFVLKVSAYAAQEGIIVPPPDPEYLAHELKAEMENEI